MVRLFGRRRKKTVKLTIPNCDCEWCHAQIEIVREVVERLERRIEHLESHLSNYYAGKEPPPEPTRGPDTNEGEDA